MLIPSALVERSTINVYDGDTIKCDAYIIPGQLDTDIRLRLEGIRCAERHATGGPEAREHLIKLLDSFPDQDLWIMLTDSAWAKPTSRRDDDFGRWIGYLQFEGAEISINEQMLIDKFADPY